jgi:hypothetical protein
MCTALEHDQSTGQIQAMCGGRLMGLSYSACMQPAGEAGAGEQAVPVDVCCILSFITTRSHQPRTTHHTTRALL